MPMSPYINLQGTARAALDFYASVFNSEARRVELFGGMPAHPDFPPMPEEIKSYIAYSEIDVLGRPLMISDVFPGMPFTQGDSMSLILQDKDADMLRNLFGKLAEGGKVEMEIQQTFWSPCYGILTDKFGVRWQVSAD
jgi:PhnB protein